MNLARDRGMSRSGEFKSDIRRPKAERRPKPEIRNKFEIQNVVIVGMVNLEFFFVS